MRTWRKLSDSAARRAPSGSAAPRKRATRVSGRVLTTRPPTATHEPSAHRTARMRPSSSSNPTTSRPVSRLARGSACAIASAIAP